MNINKNSIKFDSDIKFYSKSNMSSVLRNPSTDYEFFESLRRDQATTVVKLAATRDTVIMALML